MNLYGHTFKLLLGAGAPNRKLWIGPSMLMRNVYDVERKKNGYKIKDSNYQEVTLPGIKNA